MKKVIAIALSILTLVSQVGYALNTHYCGGEAMEVSFSLAKADLSCGMEAEEAACEQEEHHSSTIQKKSCCENAHQLFQTENEYKKSEASLQLKLDFTTLFLLVQSSIYSETEATKQLTVPAKSPPLPDRDVQVLFQTFLI